MATSSEALQGGAQGFALVQIGGLGPIVSPSLSFSTSGGAITVTSGSVGFFNMKFATLGGNFPNAQVVAVGNDNARCKLVGLGSLGMDASVGVACTTATGAPVNTAFVVQYSRKTTGNGPSAYLLSIDPTSATSIPPSDFSFNSTGGTNHVTRTSTGRYSAFLPGLAVNGGAAEVTALFGTSEHCKIVSWGPSGTEQLVNVSCFNAAGIPADSKFSLNYYGHETASVFNRGAYALASNPTTASYTPGTNKSWDSRGHQCNGSHSINVARRDAVGRYRMNHPEMDGVGSSAFVTAHGTGSSYCKLTGWGSDGGTGANVSVSCFSSAGFLVDSQYVETYATKFPLFFC